MALSKEQLEEIKESLSVDDIYSVLDELGANPTMTSNMIMADTICHNHPGEGSKKLYYYDNTKLFRCYTDCGDTFDIFELVVKVADIQYGETWELPRAIYFITNKFGISAHSGEEFDEIVSQDWSIFKNIKKLLETKADTGVAMLKEYADGVLKCFPTPIILPWLNEGISRETMNRYEISYNPKEAQIVIPHRDVNGRLVGVRGRTLVQEEAELYGKYRPMIINKLMYNHPLGFNLYGLDHNKENIKIIKKAIIFESEKSVMLYDSYFGAENNISVANCGSAISKHHIQLLLDLGVQEIVIAFDRQFQEVGDNEFKRLVKNIQKIGDKYKPYATISCIFDKQNLLDYKSSPIDHGKEVFLELFKNRIYL